MLVNKNSLRPLCKWPVASSHTLVFCLILLLPHIVKAQITLDDKIYLTSSNVSSFEEKLEAGYQAFQLSGLEVNSKLVDTAYKWLESSPNESLIWIISDNDEVVATALENLPIQSKLFLLQDMDLRTRIT